MPAVQAPALWLSVAATAVTAVAVTAMAISGGPQRPLTFAGALLRPAGHTSASPSMELSAEQATRPAASSAPRAEPRPSASPTDAYSVPGYPVPVGLPVQNHPPGPLTSTAAHSPAAAAGTPAVHPPHPSPTSVPVPVPVDDEVSALAQSLVTALNAARVAAGLAPLSWSPGLQRSAAGHNLAMSGADQLGPRVGDEPALGVRQANQGVIASYAAESSSYAEGTSLSAALALQQLILAEQPPADSRRKNLLSEAVNAVGIDILADPAHGRLWLTEDFAQLS